MEKPVQNFTETEIYSNFETETTLLSKQPNIDYANCKEWSGPTRAVFRVRGLRRWRNSVEVEFESRPTLRILHLAEICRLIAVEFSDRSKVCQEWITFPDHFTWCSKCIRRPRRSLGTVNERPLGASITVRRIRKLHFVLFSSLNFEIVLQIFFNIDSSKNCSPGPTQPGLSSGRFRSSISSREPTQADHSVFYGPLLHKTCIIKCEMCIIKYWNKVKYVVLKCWILKKKNKSLFSCLLY